MHGPSGDVPDGNFSVHYSGDASFSSLALSTIVPEIDQLKFGSYLMPYADAVIDGPQSVRIRRLLLDVYRELRAEAAFVEAGSALGMCYDDAIWRSPALLHFYQYVPRQLGRETYPVLIFLHGAMGNFKGYTWVFTKLADEHGYAIIAPTYGGGTWSRDEKLEVLDAVHEHITREAELDQGAAYLAGLSNGGMGVSRAIAKRGARYRGFAYLSPVIEPAIIMGRAFGSDCKDRPVLIIHGEADRRIPQEGVRGAAAILASRGFSVTSRFYKDEDHFLLFSQRASVVEEMARWLASCEEGAVIE